MPDEMPLADALTRVVKEIARITESKLSEADAVRILTSAYILAGMRVHSEAELSLIFQEYGMVKSSTVWDQKLYEGELRGIRESLIRVAAKRFGSPTEKILNALSTIDEKERLWSIQDAIDRASNWDELIASHSQ
jgi:hypothetical protein